MPLSDDQLLAFDGALYARYDEGEARGRLGGENGDTYRAHLVAALLLDEFRARTLEHDMTQRSDTFTPDYLTGWETGIGEAIASLRQGDLAPGGAMYKNALGEE